jgi:hypothetical protein
MKTYLLSLESTKFDYILLLDYALNKLNGDITKPMDGMITVTYSLNISVNESAVVDLFNCIQHFNL